MARPFPRFVLAGLAFPIVGGGFEVLAALLVPAPFTVAGLADVALRSEAEGVAEIIFYPFVLFGLFYLSSRVRVNLAENYVGVAASIFLGALVWFLLGSLIPAFFDGPQVIDALSQSTASAVSVSLNETFVGFAAILLSYRRRM
jgi:hypothetical protein